MLPPDSASPPALPMLPKDVVSVWHHHRVFDKQAYRDPTVRKKPDSGAPWHATATDYVAHGELRVSPPLAATQEFKSRSLLLIDYAADAASQAVLNYREQLHPASLFSVGRRDDDLWLQLNPGDPIFAGYPVRAGFDVAPLLLGDPIRVRLNARWWHSYGRREATQYYEWDFVFEYLGSFTTYTLASETQPVSCDPTRLKIIDLRKPLH